MKPCHSYDPKCERLSWWGLDMLPLENAGVHESCVENFLYQKKEGAAASLWFPSLVITYHLSLLE